VKFPDPYTPFPLTATVAVKITAPEHVASFGPYRLNVMLPPATGEVEAPLSVAVSWIGFPITTFADASVVTAGVAGFTTTDSFAPLQALLVAVLLVSPE
jgi:hypothetical protein